MKLFKTKENVLNQLSDFYLECGYGSTFDGSDAVFYAIEAANIIGVVRIAQEHGALVLRGMQVLPKLRDNNVGRKLLNYNG